MGAGSDDYFDDKEICLDKKVEFNDTFTRKMGNKKSLRLAPYRDPKTPMLRGRLIPWKAVMEKLRASLLRVRKTK